MARDYTKYNVEGLGENLNKRKLVFTVVKDYVEKNNPSFEDLQKAFPDEVQGSKGVVAKEAEIKDPKRYNVKEPLKIKNGAHVVVCNQWGENINDFIEVASNLGFSIVSHDKLEEEEKSVKVTQTMKAVGYLAVKKNFADNASDKINKDALFKKLQLPDSKGVLLLLNYGIATYELGIPQEEYLYAEINEYNEVNFSGEWTDMPDDDFCSVRGALTFIISEINNESHYSYLKELYSGVLIKNDFEIIESFMANGFEYVQDFIENYDEQNPESEQANTYWKLLEKLSEETGEDLHTVTQSLILSYSFYQLGISIESDDEKRTLICCLDGMLPLKKYFEYKDILEDEMSELEEGDGDSFDFAYSLWKGTSNRELFEKLELDSGDYLSYPTLVAGDFQAEPETGEWY